MNSGPCRGIRILREKRKMIKTKYYIEQMKQNKDLFKPKPEIRYDEEYYINKSKEHLNKKEYCILKIIYS